MAADKPEMTMAKSTIRTTPSTNAAGDRTTLIEWVRPDGTVEFDFNTGDVHLSSMFEMVVAYGVKQIISDAGAVEKGTTDAERLGKMHKRAQALRDGTWSFRDGHAAPKPAAERDAQFNALVMIGVIPEEYRAAWNALRPTERAAVMRDNPDAQKLLDIARPTVDGAAILSRILGK
jgi:hypothetical protein